MRNLETILAKTQGLLSDDGLAEQIASCIKGETVVRKYKVVQREDGTLVERATETTRTTTPADQARGLALASRLGIINLGGQEKALQVDRNAESYELYAPEVDVRVIARKEG